MTQPTQTPDSVRLALPGVATSIAAIQRRSWQQLFTPEVADTLLRSIDLDAMTGAWVKAILAPPLAEYRVLVAVGSGRLVGFAAVGPSGDPDAVTSEDAVVAEFVIDPQAQRQGHGSRLLNAVADTLRADKFQRASVWVQTSNDALRSFVISAGWAPDGAHREQVTPDDAASVKLVRLVTTL